MAEVVFIHGIGQQHWGKGETLQRIWLKALRKGSSGQAGFSVEEAMERSAMVFYGDLFVRPGAQGDDPREGGWSDEDLVLAEQLAEAWIERAAASETNERLRREGEAALSELKPPPEDAEPLGVQAWVRSTIGAASRIHFFAEQGFAAAETILWRDLKQVSSYIVPGDIRNEIRSRAEEALAKPDVLVVVAHSLGTVVAYEAITALGRELELWVTIGSPLGLDRPIYQRLHPAASFPSTVTRWVNMADPDDIIAAAPVLQPLFPSPDGRYVEDLAVVNDGWWRHSITKYFQQPALVDLVGRWFR